MPPLKMPWAGHGAPLRLMHGMDKLLVAGGALGKAWLPMPMSNQPCCMLIPKNDDICNLGRVNGGSAGQVVLRGLCQDSAA